MHQQLLFALIQSFFLIACSSAAVYALWDLKEGVTLYLIASTLFVVMRFAFFSNLQRLEQENLPPLLWWILKLLHLCLLISGGVLVCYALAVRFL